MLLYFALKKVTKNSCFEHQQVLKNKIYPFLKIFPEVCFNLKCFQGFCTHSSLPCQEPLVRTSFGFFAFIVNSFNTLKSGFWFALSFYEYIVNINIELDQVNSANLLFELWSLVFYVLICYRICRAEQLSRGTLLRRILSRGTLIYDGTGSI